jgi:hypothetical protein
VPWVALDVAIAVLPLVGIVLVLLGLWRSVKAFPRTAGEAGESVGAASDRLAATQAAGADRR